MHVCKNGSDLKAARGSLIKRGALSGLRKQRERVCVCVRARNHACQGWGQVPGALCSYLLTVCRCRHGNDIIAHKGPDDGKNFSCLLHSLWGEEGVGGGGGGGEGASQPGEEGWREAAEVVGDE